MACFLVPAAEALIVTAAAKIQKSKEAKTVSADETEGKAAQAIARTQIALSRKLMWLSYLLWGGALLLAYEHIWHGEVVPWFPFLTAAADPADAAVMLHEMSTVGVCMALLVTVVWGVMMYAARKIVSRKTVSAAVAAK